VYERGEREGEGGKEEEVEGVGVKRGGGKGERLEVKEGEEGGKKGKLGVQQKKIEKRKVPTQGL